MRALASLFGLLYASSAFAWGLSTELNEPWAQARLVFPALQQKRITYCLKNEVAGPLPRGERGAPGGERPPPLAFRRRRRRRKNLPHAVHRRLPPLVQLGQEKRWKGLGTYQLSSWDQSHYYSLIKFDSGFRRFLRGTKIPITDFRHFSAIQPPKARS